jgi:tetratricopeptide (TPR) repeat protein
MSATARNVFGIRLAMTALCLAASLASPTGAIAQTPPKAEARKILSSEELYDHTLKGTCWLTFRNTSGTGWVLNKEQRLVVTNDHVVEGTDLMSAYFPVKKNDTPITEPEWYRKNQVGIRAVVIDRNRRCDLALLQLDAMPDTAHDLPLAVNFAKQGQEIMTVGAYTNGSQGVWGWVDGKVRNVVDSQFRDGKLRRVESNVATNSGNSGGPVVNNRGEIVAVHHAANTEATNVSYHIDLTELKGFLAVALPLVDPKGAMDFINRGDHRMSTGRYQAAREDFTSAVKLDGKLARAYLGRGMATHLAGDSETALLDYQEALQLDPENQKALYWRGKARMRLDQNEEAAEDFTQVIRLNPRSNSAYNDRGVVLFNLKKYEESEADFARAIELNPSSPLHWKNRGDAREKLGKVDDAISDLEKAIELQPSDPQMYVSLGLMLKRAERYEAAGKVLIRGDELSGGKLPIFPDAYGDVMNSQEKWESAVKLYTMALERVLAMEKAGKSLGNFRPEITLVSRGFCLRRLENYDASLEDHNRALKIKPDYARAFYQRSWTYRWLGDYDKAKEDYDHAVKLDKYWADQEAPVIVRSSSGFYPGISIRRR